MVCVCGWLVEGNIVCCSAHHHLAELVKVHGSRSVLVNFVNDAVEIFRGEPGIQLGNDFAQLAGGDESGAVLVVDAEGLLQLGLHGLLVGLLDQELGAQLAKLSKLNLAGSVLVDFLQDLLQLLLAGPEAHGSEDVVQVIGTQKVLLPDVEQVEAELEDLDLVDLQGSGLGDLVKVNVGKVLSFVAAIVCL